MLFEEYRKLTDEELANQIKNTDMWDADLVEELIRRASVFDETVEEDFEKAGDDNYDIDAEAVLERAANILGVEIF